jgi:hypothetical protein
MKHLNTYFIIVLLITVTGACNPTKNLVGKSFKSHSKHRTAKLNFDNDSIGRFINIFHCTDIDPEYKTVTILFNYRKTDDKIILKNINCKSDSCTNNFTLDIPLQSSKKCSFLNKDKREKRFGIGPNYLTAYEKYGFVPSLDIDTVYIVKRKLIFVKQQNWRSIGFVLK